MKHIYVPADSPEDWRRLLAEPEKQWRAGYSARLLAECWQAAEGFPAEVQALLSGAAEPALRKLELLLAIPEYQVALPGGGRPSQNDLFALGRAADGQLAVLMVEGKVAEPFGDTLETWLRRASPGKLARLEFLCQALGLSNPPPGALRYQLLHRTVSAILEAQRFNAAYALMVVHSFSPEQAWLADYQAFLALFGVTAGAGTLARLPIPGKLPVYAGWAAYGFFKKA